MDEQGDSTDGPERDDGSGAERDGTAPRDVPVPLEVYKTVTVFSTLFAVVLVVGGMITLDVATARGTLPVDEINLPLAAAGLLAIVLGAAVYAFSTRFRADGMGNPKDADDEGTDDG